MAVDVGAEAVLSRAAGAVRVVELDGWGVTSCSVSPDDVAVAGVGDVLLVTVGDGPGAATSVTLRPDGSLTVHAGTTPPALLVSQRAARTVPAVPGVPETLRLDTGQRLLVLSSDALDALPRSLVQVLQALPEQVTGRDPSDLLTELFADLPGGSGAIVVRRPALGPAPDPDQEEATWGSAPHS